MQACQQSNDEQQDDVKMSNVIGLQAGALVDDDELLMKATIG